MTLDKLHDIRTIPLAIQCGTCGYLYMRGRHTHESGITPTRQYVVGNYGAIKENSEWRKRQESSQHVWKFRPYQQAD